MSEGTVQTYLFFDGNCEEAMAWYVENLGAEVQMMMRFSDAPEPMPPGMLEEGYDNKVMHVTFTLAGTTLMASDGMRSGTPMSGFSLSLALADEAGARAAFDRLAEGGEVQMPIGPTFWSSCFGQVTDRFGLTWMVTVDEPMPG